MKETKGEERVVLVVQVMEEERRVFEIERRVLGKKGVLPVRLCPSDPANFYGEIDKVSVFSIWVVTNTNPIFGLSGEASELGSAKGVLKSEASAMADGSYERM